MSSSSDDMQEVIHNIQVTLGGFLQVVWDTTAKHYVVHELCSELTGALRVTFSQLIKFNDDWVRGVNLERVVLVLLTGTSLALLLHHGHDHAHGGTHLTEEDCWLISQTSGD